MECISPCSSRLSRFYPGVAMPSFAQIAESEKPAGSIEGPESEQTIDFDSTSARASGTDTRGRNLRATRVIGSLDHAVLPMPPVCFSGVSCDYFLMLHILCSVKR